jgi:hypothetical protein
MAQDDTPREWPSHFPEGCPYSDALDARGEMFRFVPPDGDRWTPTPGYFNRPPCVRAALSCYPTRESLEAMGRIVPRFRGASIMRAILEPRHGKVQQTGRPPHHSVWLRAAVLAKADDLFTVVA